MIRYFNYDCAQDEALELAKNSLLDLGYKIDLMAPEGYFMVTKMQGVKKDIRQYAFRIAVLVEDRVEVIIVAQRKVFKRDSEASIGGKDLIQTETSDRLPYSLQRSIFYPIINEFTKNGLVEVEDIALRASV
jgi:allophanate hydrolase subunit 2